MTATARLRNFALGDFDDEARIVLKARGMLRGVGVGHTTISPAAGMEGEFVATEDLSDWEEAEDGGWVVDGAPYGVEIRDITLDGQRGVPTYPWEEPDTESLLDAISIYGPGSRINNVKVHDFDGVALKLGRNGNTLTGELQAGDDEIHRVNAFHCQRVHAGAHIVSGADHAFQDYACLLAREWGLKAEGGATNFNGHLHIAGVATYDETDLERGIGIINGTVDGLSGENYYNGTTQVDNCRVGIKNYGANSPYTLIVSKLCQHTGFHAVRSAKIGIGLFTKMGGDPSDSSTFNASPIGMQIEQDALGTTLQDGLFALSAGATSAKGVLCRTQHARLTYNFYGSGYAGVTGLEMGYEGQVVGPYNCLINADLSWMGTGCKIWALGKNNTIIIRHGSVDNPLVRMPGVVVAGNRIRLENAATGLVEDVED